MWNLPIDGIMDEPDPASFEFIPDVGYRYIGDGRSVIIANSALTKEREVFYDTDIFNYAVASQTYLDGIKDIEKQHYDFRPVLKAEDFQSFCGRYIFKFMAEEAYSKFAKNGSFLLSSLQRFRDFEEQGSPAGDRFEGSAYCCFTVENRNLLTSTMSGFDMLIFSAAADLSAVEDMRLKFGPVILRIDLAAFAGALGRQIGGIPVVRAVRYADLKMYRADLSLKSVVGFPQTLKPKLARALRTRARLPSVFAKPQRFEAENEIRIAFLMDRDVPAMKSVNIPHILRQVTRID